MPTTTMPRSGAARRAAGGVSPGWPASSLSPPFALARVVSVVDSPEESASLFSIITFWWIGPLMTLGYKQPLTAEDLWALNPGDSAASLAALFRAQWDKRVARGAPSLIGSFAGAFGPTLLASAFFKIVQDSLAFVSPIILDRLITCAARRMGAKEIGAGWGDGGEQKE